MGGRSSASEDSMAVPYDNWGKEVREELRNSDGVYGYIEDENVYLSEPDISRITKKQILDDIEGYRNDDGTYGDNDVGIFITYKDGSTYWNDNAEGGFKKSGIIGVSVSTPDYQAAWGEDFVGSGGDKRRVPMTTSALDGVPELSNSYVGYKTTGVYKQRVKTTYNNWNEKKQRYEVKREIVRKSKVKNV